MDVPTGLAGKGGAAGATGTKACDPWQQEEVA
jgi:hypothetical protein